MGAGTYERGINELALELLQTLHDEGTIKGYRPDGGPSRNFTSDGRIRFLGRAGKEIRSLKQLNQIITVSEIYRQYLLMPA